MPEGKGDRPGPSQISAWLRPGLALGWLAVLAAFVHGVGNLLAAWAATVSLAILLGRRRSGGSPGQPHDAGSGQIEPSSGSGTATSASPAPATDRPDATHAPAGSEERAAGDGGYSANAPENAATSVSHGVSDTETVSDLDESAPRPAQRGTVAGAVGQTEQPGTPGIIVPPDLRVLTAAEVASVLRVGRDVIITAISSGELPGNQVGNHWRVGRGALERWLQGAYVALDSPGQRSSAEPGFDPRSD